MKRLFGRIVAGIAAALLVSASAQAAAPKAPLQSAVFAGGCFWCMESDMKNVPGVVDVQSGYTGGTVKNPTYQDVTSERSGHYEAVKVTFDPAKISYAGLLTRYWKLVDPTDPAGQFCDRGPSYRTAVFVTPDQKAAAEASRDAAAKKLKMGKMTTQILPLQVFYPAEEYHRDYAHRNKLNYTAYRLGCGRDRRLAQVWGQG